MSPAPDDPFNLRRFLDAQEQVYDTALRELKRGRKETHWMWFIFPQIEGLGSSAMSQRYSIKSRDEAVAYLRHPVLGGRLKECAGVLLDRSGTTATDIMGFPDDMKLQSCMTLFAGVSDAGSVFHQVIDNYFQGMHDQKTLQQIDADRA